MITFPVSYLVVFTHELADPKLCFIDPSLIREFSTYDEALDYYEKVRLDLDLKRIVYDANIYELVATSHYSPFPPFQHLMRPISEVIVYEGDDDE